MRHKAKKKKGGMDNVYLNVTQSAVTFDHASTRVVSNGTAKRRKLKAIGNKQIEARALQLSC